MKTLLSTIPKLANELSDGSLIKFLMILTQLWFFALSRKVSGSTADFPMTFSYLGRKMRIALQHPMDLAVLREIYIEKEYAWCPVQNPKVIVDLGAHFGDTALYYNARFPEAVIIAIEPAPQSFARLIENTKSIPQIKCLQVAVGEADGELDLHIMPSSLGNSLMSRDMQIGTTKVKVITLSALMSHFGLEQIDLLKFDIEGAEFSVFKNFRNNQKVLSLIGEVHEDLGGDTVQTFTTYFTDKTVETERLMNQKRFIVKIL